MATTKKKKQTFAPENVAGTFKPNISQAVESVKSGVSDFISGVKETAQAVGEAVPGVTSIGQGLKSYANMNNYKTAENAAQQKLKYLEANAPGEYKESDELISLRGELADVENQKPGAFENKYQQQIDALLGKMTNQDPFSYDFSTDSNWLAAQEQAKRNALLAMENAMGEAAGLTGGYASSAAQMVGQQAYQQEISETTEMIPEFAQMALNKWQANNSQMASNLAALQSQQDSDYSRFYNDFQLWNQDRAYMYQKVQDMSDDEFNQYITGLNRWQTDRAYYADQKQMAIQNQQWQQELNESRRQFNSQMAFNYINMGVGAAVDLTTAGMSAGVQLAGIGADAALGAAELTLKDKEHNDSLLYDYAALAEEQRQFDAGLAYDDKWKQSDYELAMAQLAEEQRQFDTKNPLNTQSVSGSSRSTGGTKGSGGSIPSQTGNKGGTVTTQSSYSGTSDNIMNEIPEDLRLYLKNSDRYTDSTEGKATAILTALDREKDGITEEQAERLFKLYGIDY